MTEQCGRGGSRLGCVMLRAGLALCLTLSACAGTAPGPHGPPAAGTDGAPTPAGTEAPSTSGTTPVSEAAAAIAEFSTQPERLNSSFADIHRHARERPAELRDAALDQLASATGPVRYAALYALALTADGTGSMDALREVLTSDDVNERMLAAGSLIARGEKAAFPVLIELLGSDEQLAFRDPPQEAWRFARFVLIQYTREDMGLLGPTTFSAEQAAAARTAWERWWVERGDGLRYDEEERVYR